MKTRITLLTLMGLFFLWLPVFSLTDSIVDLPFEKAGHLIIVEAEVEGKKGKFVLDTGVPVLWLNAKYFDGLPVRSTTSVVSGLAGKREKVRIYPTIIKLQNIKKAERALLVDLTYLEEAKGIRLLGMIGRSTLKKFEILFDLQNKKLQLIPIDKKGEPRMALTRPPCTEVSFEMAGHIPVFSSDINGLQLTMGFDSGAEVNVIDPSYKKTILNLLGWKDRLPHSRNGDKRTVLAYYIPGMELNYYDCKDMRTIFSSMKKINNSLTGTSLDGLLGVEFLAGQKVSFNFRKNVMYLYGEENWGAEELIVDKNKND